MSEYHKIQTVWLRDPATKHRTLLEGAWAKPEFEYLADLEWTLTEKVDGTNIRIAVNEGLVMRPAVELYNRRGERVIAKIKAKDFAPTPVKEDA